MRERRDAFAPQYDKANILGTVLCVLSAVPVFAAVMVGASFLVSASIFLVLSLVACGVYAFVRVGTVRDAMDQLLEEGDFTRPNKAIKSRINALTAAYWLVVVAIFLWYTFGPQGNGQPQYSWFIWAMRRGVRRAGNCGQGVYEEESVKAAPPTKNGWGRYFCRDVGARHAWPGCARQTSAVMARLQAGACPRPLQSNQMEMPQRLRQAVFHNIIRDIIRGLLGGITGVAHGDADARIVQHRHIIAAVTKGDGLLPGQAQMRQRVARPLGLPPPSGRISQKSSSQRTARQPGQRRRNSASFSGGRNALSW